MALEGCVIYDDYFDAIMGYGMTPADAALVYDVDKCIDELSKTFVDAEPENNPDSARDEAVKYFDFDVAGRWVGAQTPYLLRRTDDCEALEGMRKTFPGFIGCVERCGCDPSALFAIESQVKDPIRILHPDGNESIIPVFKLIEL